MLLDRPESHLNRGYDGEEEGAEGQGQDSHSDPREHLEEIVRAAHELECRAVRDLAHTRSLGAQVHQDHVALQVKELSRGPRSDNRRDECGVVAQRAGDRSGAKRRRVYAQGQEDARKAPVVRRVLEDVEQRHSAVREAVHPDRLSLALDKVEQDKHKGRGLNMRHGKRTAKVTPDMRRSKVHNGVDDEGTGVFDEEHGAPANLRAEVLHIQTVASLYAQLDEALFVANERRLVLRRDALALDRETRHHLRDRLLEGREGA